MFIIAGSWWAFILRGVVAVLFGILTFVLPGIALATLVFLFGFYAIADGVINLIAAFRRAAPATPPQPPRWARVLQGILGIGAGVIAFALPGITALALLYIIAAWAIMTGALEIAAAISLRKEITGEWILALSGVLSIIFGVLLAIFPGPGALVVVWWIGAYALVFGILLIALGIKLRKTVRDLLGHAPQRTPQPAVAGH